jgi:hypothetical protein
MNTPASARRRAWSRPRGISLDEQQDVMLIVLLTALSAAYHSHQGLSRGDFSLSRYPSVHSSPATWRTTRPGLSAPMNALTKPDGIAKLLRGRDLLGDRGISRAPCHWTASRKSRAAPAMHPHSEGDGECTRRNSEVCHIAEWVTLGYGSQR